MRYTALILLLLTLLTAACKDDRDEVAPEVSISQPAEGLTIVMPDTIAVAATAEDNVQLELLSYGLVDADFAWVGERVYVSDPGNPESFNQTLSLTDLDIETGPHYVEVLASDGENDRRAYRAVNVIGIPRYYLGTSYVHAEGGSWWAGWTDASGTRLDHVSDGQGICAAASGRQNALYCYKESVNVLEAYRLNDGLLMWSDGEVIPVDETVVDCVYDPELERIYLLSDEPRMFKYSKEGVAQGSWEIDADYDVGAFVLDGEYMYLLSMASAGHRLSQIYKSSGFEVEHRSLPEEPQQLAVVDDELVVVVEADGDLRVVDFDSGDQYSVPVSGAGEVQGMLSDEGRAYWATESAVYRYEADDNSVLEIYTGSGITGLSYDTVGQRLVVAEQGTLVFVDAGTGQVMGSLPAGTGASDLQALFNK